VQERGARYTLIMLDEKQKKVGVIAASAGDYFLINVTNYLRFPHNYLRDLIYYDFYIQTWASSWLADTFFCYFLPKTVADWPLLEFHSI
jgi:hypothetical protein